MSYRQNDDKDIGGEVLLLGILLISIAAVVAVLFIPKPQSAHDRWQAACSTSPTAPAPDPTLCQHTEGLVIKLWQVPGGFEGPESGVLIREADARLTSLDVDTSFWEALHPQATVLIERYKGQITYLVYQGIFFKTAYAETL